MQLRTIAVDDEPLALELLRQYINQFPRLNLIHSFTDSTQAAEWLKDNPIDLLLIDINMPELPGIKLVKALREKPLLIFTTACKQYAIDGFDLEAVDYLLKPIPFDRFSRAVNRAVSLFDYEQLKGAGSTLYVRSEYRLIKIPLGDIEYVESISDYLKIHLIDGKVVMTLMTLKSILEKLPPTLFTRIHRSYVVSIENLRAVSNNKACLSSVSLPISNKYQEIVKEWKKRHIPQTPRKVTYSPIHTQSP